MTAFWLELNRLIKNFLVDANPKTWPDDGASRSVCYPQEMKLLMLSLVWAWVKVNALNFFQLQIQSGSKMGPTISLIHQSLRTPRTSTNDQLIKTMTFLVSSGLEGPPVAPWPSCWRSCLKKLKVFCELVPTLLAHASDVIGKKQMLVWRSMNVWLILHKVKQKKFCRVWIFPPSPSHMCKKITYGSEAVSDQFVCLYHCESLQKSATFFDKAGGICTKFSVPTEPFWE